MSPQHSEQKSCTVVPKPKMPNMAYTNCRTYIVDLRPLNLPTDPNTPDSVLRQLYSDYISANKSPDSPNHKHSRYLASAITSLTTGIAPPVAFPTETVYGLGADATNPSSIAGIFAAKGRPSDNPLIVHVSSIEHLERCLGGMSDKSAVPSVYRDLIREFWPGPLTILIPVPLENKGVRFAPNVHPGQSTIGFRLPSSPYARFLMAVTDRPIAAPSANSSGKPSPTTARHVMDDLDGKINFILDGGSCDVGVESTVVDGLGAVPLILRPGGLSKVDLKQWGKEKGNVWAHVENGWEVKKKGVKRKRSGEDMATKEFMQLSGIERLSNGHDQHINGISVPNGTDERHDKEEEQEEEEEDTSAPRAPGMKYKHYAPSGRMLLIEASTAPEKAPSQPKTTEVLSTLIYDLLQQTRFLNLPTPKYQNGDLAHPATAASPIQPLTISILTSTSWPAFANLESCFPNWNAKHVPGSTYEDIRLTSPLMHNKDLDPYRTHHEDVKERVIDMYTINLGHDSTTISNRLFAALRTCDDLRSDLILAEAPTKTRISTMKAGKAIALMSDVSAGAGVGDDSNSVDDNDEFETVLERMRKAASEIVRL